MSGLPTNYLTPTGREEAWRFTPLKRLSGLHDSATSVLDRISIELVGSVRVGFNIETVASADLPPKSTTEDVIIQRIRATASKITHLKIDKEAVVSEPIFLKRSAGTEKEFSRTVVT
ncbi:MAG: Fe-S cluster assembly protein SufD, partial [Actinomycetota bacterium]